MQMLSYHPLADVFPLIEGADFDDLVASIKKCGLIHPIVLFEGRILDGRNRYRACLAAGIEPDFVDFDEVDPEKQAALVEALNVTRRHLSDSQRALLAAQLTKKGTSQADMGRQMNVSERSVQKAAVVLKSGDAEVIDFVAKGKTSINRAEQVVTGKAPRTTLTGDRRGPGRPVGDSHIRQLIKCIDTLMELKGRHKKILDNWPGDPDLNAKLASAAEFLSGLSVFTQENDLAAARS